jgi:cellobiose-specific phosphotransferase system component IIC
MPGDRTDDVSQGTERAPRPTASGAGRILVAVYGVFALAATSRAGVQLATKYHEAPLAYVLSAFSAVVYVIATVALAMRGARARQLAWTAVGTELVGVLVIGTFSLIAPKDFPHATVWSTYGIGYGFVPLVLPFIGLWWLRRTSRPT